MFVISVVTFFLYLTCSDGYRLVSFPMSAKSKLQSKCIQSTLSCGSFESALNQDRIPTVFSSPLDITTVNAHATDVNSKPASADSEAVYLTADTNGTWEKVLHWNIVDTFGAPVLRKVIADEDILDLSTKVLSGLAWFAVVMGALGTIGFDTKPILSIFSIAGITLGLSLKDAFADIYAGLFVMFTRPFKRGSVVNIAGYEGKVVSMDMRYVRLRNSTSKSDILIPSSIVYKNVIRLAKEGV